MIPDMNKIDIIDMSDHIDAKHIKQYGLEQSPHDGSYISMSSAWFRYFTIILKYSK